MGFVERLELLGEDQLLALFARHFKQKRALEAVFEFRGESPLNAVVAECARNRPAIPSGALSPIHPIVEKSC